MPIERITADDLRDMEHQEGLVLQGCGGEAQGGLGGVEKPPFSCPADAGRHPAEWQPL